MNKRNGYYENSEYIVTYAFGPLFSLCDIEDYQPEKPTAPVRWKMEGWHLHVNLKAVGKFAFGVLGALVLGVGMCMIMVWNIMIPGMIVGVVGIALLVCLIPMCFGLK